MDDDEYFVDKNSIIHNNCCPYKSVPWFTAKKSKYDFIQREDQQFCKECFSNKEIQKMMQLNEFNSQIE